MVIIIILPEDGSQSEPEDHPLTHSRDCRSHRLQAIKSDERPSAHLELPVHQTDFAGKEQVLGYRQ